jgi:hypothetical protein
MSAETKVDGSVVMLAAWKGDGSVEKMADQMAEPLAAARAAWTVGQKAEPLAAWRAVKWAASKGSLTAVPKAVRWDGHWAAGSVDDSAESMAALSVAQSAGGSAAY